MFTETLNSTSRKEEVMELENSMAESDDDDEDEDDDDDTEFPPLPSDIDFLPHKTTSDPYDNRHHAIDLFYCPSPASPSPPPPPPSFLSASSMPVSQIYANTRTFSSIRTQGNPNQSTISFATQQKKKARAPIANLLQSVYVNLPILRSLPPPLPKPVNLPDEVTYATLLNTTSIVPSNSSDLTINHVEYQQIQNHRPNSAVDSIRIYENIKTRRPPPEPYYSQTNAPKRPPTGPTFVPDVDQILSCTKTNTDESIPISSTHIYINLQYHEDKPPLIPTRACKSTPIITATPPSSPPLLPPVIPRRKAPIRCSSSNVTISSTEKEQESVNLLETSSNASTVRTIKELENNMTPSCGDKSDLYRTKMSLPATENPPSLVNTRSRRTVHSTRRRRLRGSVALRGSIALRSTVRGGTTNPSSHRQQQQQSHQRSNANITVRHPMVTDDRWRRTLRKRRRQRAVQMKLDGNTLRQQTRPISDHTYNEIKQPTPGNNAPRTSPNNGSAGGVLERAMQFNGALRDRVFSWYRGANQNGQEQITQQQVKIPAQLCSTSENGESDRKESMTQEDGDEEEEEEEEEDEEDEEEEEFFTHDTFEDFLLRRRPKSSASTTVSGTSTIVSRMDSISQRLPVRISPKQKTRTHPPPPPPPLPPPLPSTPPPARRFPGLALGLDKTDVDFIHNILQRTRGDHRVWNRITALKEAYIRATSKKSDLPKKPKPIVNQMDDEKKKKKAMMMKHSLAATKIRAELEKYDELPASSATVLDDEDDYDETCSANDHRRIHHHRSVPALPQTPSTTHRLLNFVTSMKRRAQTNVQQLQKNLHDIRSRVHTEAMTVPTNHIGIQRHTSNTSRQRQTFKDVPNPSRMHLPRTETASNQHPLVRRTNSHRSATSVDHSSAAIHRRQLNRTQSNASQLPQQRHTHRTINIVEPSSNSIARPLPFERHSSRQTQGGATSRRQRAKQT